MGDAVDLDEVHRAVGGGDEAVGAALDGDPPHVVVDAVDRGVDDVGVAAVLDRDAVAVGRRAQHHDLVCRAAQFEVDGAPHGVLDLRTSATGGLEEASALDGLGVLVGLDAGGDEGDARVPRRDEPALGAHAVDPAGVGRAVDDLGLVEQVEDEALVGGTAVDDDGRLGERAAQARQSLVPVATVGDDLGDHRVEVGGDRVALSHAGVDPDARPGREVEQLDATR